jgi:hypothetical protein
VGSLFEEQVQLSLAGDDGELLATMWAGEYQARLDPLVVLDEEGRIVARGGEHLFVSGGFLPPADPRIAGYNGVFSISRVLREASRL